MNPRDLIPTAEDIKAVQNIEAELHQRRRTGMLGAIVGIGGALTQVVLAAAGKENYITAVGQFIQGARGRQLNWQLLTSPKAIGFFAIILGFGLYFILRRTSFLMNESKQPFQYTFWIKPFEDAGPKREPATPRVVDNRLHLLHHDLMERLNERIPRLSLLNENGGATAVPRMKSHISISGHYALRDLNDDPDWAVQVMPRIRIGPATEPATLAHSAFYLFEGEGAPTFSANNYKQLVERVYSSIATEVYKQIESDVKEKMYLFPTPYMRAVAFYHEAEDFARSNTIDAYDRAIELYRESVRHFNITTIKWFARLTLTLPVIWRLKIRSKHMQARVRIGYAKSLIYRRQISALTGRHMNPLYEIHESVEQEVKDLKRLHRRIGKSGNEKRSSFLMAGFTFPKDSWFRFISLRPLQSLFERQRQVLFDAHVVAALTNFNLGANSRAEEHLRDAAAVDPQMSERNALYLLAAAQVESDLDKRILLLEQATEVAPDFQIAQYLLAKSCQLRFQERAELVKARADRVLKEYEAVLTINPGNIAALAAQGYVWWLLDEPEPKLKKECLAKARRRFEEGREIKAIEHETFVGEINYGLARIAAEEGKFNTAYDLLALVVASDPGIGAYSTIASHRNVSSYYDFINSSMLSRYRKFKNKVKSYRNGKEPLDEAHRRASPRIRRVLYSFALNDYGNASLNYFFRFGHSDRLKVATKAFEQAVKEDPDNLVAKYNLHFAYRWQPKPDDPEASFKLLEEVVEKLPNWQAAVISLTQLHAQGPHVKELRTKLVSCREGIKSELEQQSELEKSISMNQQILADLTGLHSTGRLESKTPGEALLSDGIRPSVGVTAGTKQGQRADVTAVQLAIAPTAESEVPQLQKEIQDATDRANQFGKNAAILRKDLAAAEEELRRVTRKTLGRVVKNTKLSSLFEESEIDYAGKQVDRLLSNRKIKWERLDEYDVQALVAWAEALSTNTQDRLAVRASIRLCKHLLKQYHPDNFDLTLILEDLAKSRLLSLDSDEDQKAFRDILERALKRLSSLIRRSPGDAEVDEATLKAIIQRAVVTWLMTDPTYFLALTWHHRYFDANEHLEVVRKAIQIAGSDNKYRRGLAEVYRNRMKEFLDDYLHEVEKKRLGGATTDATPEDAKPTAEKSEAAQVDDKPEQPDGFTKAFREYEIALEVMPAVPSEYSRLALELAGFEGQGKRVEAMGVALAGLEKACELDPEEPACQKRLQELREKHAIGLHFGEKALDHGPQRVSVHIGIAANLGKELPMLQGLLDDVRHQIRVSMGVGVPNAEFQIMSALDGSYTFLLNRIPFAADRIGEGERLYPGTAADLDVLGVTGIYATHPLTRSEAVWVARKDWPIVKAAGYPLWSIPEYIVRHFESVIRANLQEFVGHGEVAAKLNATAPSLYKEIIAVPAELSELTAVVRRLLAEGVPIKQFSVIAHRFSQLRTAGVELGAVIEAIRSAAEIQPTLPGNRDLYSLYRIREDLEAFINTSIYRGGSHPILFMETQKYQQAMRALRTRLSARQRKALIVENAELRPFVRDLIRLEFPHVPVLARRELLPANQKVVAEIGL